MPLTSNSLKRKKPDDRTETSSSPTSDATPQRGEYQTGRVICEVCGEGISFRNESTGGFTVEHWNSHRIACVAPGAPPSKSASSTSNVTTLSLPLAKRRRAKRTEEERIKYLRADPYVAKFEAYRVLCASCDKWIRLRPNSTYCSIPWDAHRKSCLARQINSKNIYALEERNKILSSDPYVRKYDAERVLCSICDVWLSLNADDHLQAIETWNHHRASCCKTSSSSPTSPRDTSINSVTRKRLLPPSAPSHAGPTSPEAPNISQQSFDPQLQLIAPPTFYALHPVDYSPVNDSRRRNAEHRAQTLRADPLIGKVEPNRVFCTMCQKWVQLRQDSSYCAYPWLQHRGKCMARQQRRSEKAAELAQRKARKFTRRNDEEHISDGYRGSERPESEDEMDLRIEERHIRRNHVTNMESNEVIEAMGIQRSRFALNSCATVTRDRENDSKLVGHIYSRGPSTFGPSRAPQTHDQDHRIDQDTDTDSSSFTEIGQVRRQWSVGVTDLDSVAGRKQFILSSIGHLFSTTFESTDDLSISTLVGYLNIAIPQDKYEDFGTSEVIKTAAALQNDGYIVFEGDMLRLAESA